MASQALNLILRGLQFLWTLLVMALIGNIIADAFAGNPSVINYDMFVAVFGMLSLFYLIPTTLKEDLAFHPLIAVVLDVLNVIFFLCGGIATAAELECHSCNNDNYTLHNKITNGAHNREKRCREAQASTAFLWFGFAAFAGSAFFSALASRGGAVMRGPSRRGPAMSQV